MNLFTQVIYGKEWKCPNIQFKFTVADAQHTLASLLETE